MMSALYYYMIGSKFRFFIRFGFCSILGKKILPTRWDRVGSVVNSFRYFVSLLMTVNCQGHARYLPLRVCHVSRSCEEIMSGPHHILFHYPVGLFDFLLIFFLLLSGLCVRLETLHFFGILPNIAPYFVLKLLGYNPLGECVHTDWLWIRDSD